LPRQQIQGREAVPEVGDVQVLPIPDRRGCGGDDQSNREV
jgi:hypothetical protein